MDAGPGGAGLISPIETEEEEDAMLHINRVTLLGHAGRDPEVRANGGKAAVFSLATTEKRKRQDGETVESTEWHRIVSYGAAAKAAEGLVRKGSAVLVEGRLVLREYKDKEGNARQVAEVVVSGREGMLNVLTRNAEKTPPEGTAVGAGGAPAAAKDQES